MDKVNGILLFISGLILGFFLMRGCNPPEPEVITRIDTIPGDTFTTVVTVPKPVYDTIIFDINRPVYVDTAAILRNYFAQVVYLDTLKNDSSAFIALLDTVTQNRLLSRRLYFRNNRETQIIYNTTIIKSDSRRVYAGGFVNTIGDFGPALMYSTPKGGAVGYSYSVKNNVHSASFVWPVTVRLR